MTLGHIVELLTFCVEHHTYHIKNYVINKDLLRRVLVLMASSHKFLVLSKFATGPEINFPIKVPINIATLINNIHKLTTT